MNHMEVWEAEIAIDPIEKEWIQWCSTVEQILGHTVDGDQDKDGYSMDDAYEAFEAKVSPQQYVNLVKVA